MSKKIGIANQPSTYVGIAALLGAFGIFVTPEMVSLIAGGVFAVAGLINTFIKD